MQVTKKTKIINVNGVPTQVVEVSNSNPQYNTVPIPVMQEQVLTYTFDVPQQMQQPMMQEQVLTYTFDVPQNQNIGFPQQPQPQQQIQQPIRNVNTTSRLESDIRNIRTDLINLKKEFNYNLSGIEVPSTISEESKEKIKTLKFLLKFGEISNEHFVAKIKKICLEDVEA